MKWLTAGLNWMVDFGVTSQTTDTDARYVRFLNMTFFLIALSEIPIIWLLGTQGLAFQLQVNLLALGVCGFGFVLNGRGHHLMAKILIMGVMNANTAYFAVILGSSSPTHLWLIPGAALGLLAFKPSEWRYATVLVGLSMVGFFIFEFGYQNMEPLVRYFSDPGDALRAAQGSTVSAMVMTLVLIGMMHRRFARAETELSYEKAQSDRLLRAILPAEIARELRDEGGTKAVRHEDVSLLFADIVGFTPLAASMPAEDVVALLAEVFERFDGLIAQCGVEKIKTIGDAYMVAGGVPQAIPDHAERLARCAFGMLDIIEAFSAESAHHLQLRIGLHRGPVVAGVIGTTKFAYDLWGESVNLASRLESSGEPGRIHVSEAFRAGLEPLMIFEKRGQITLKGVGDTQTHWLMALASK